MLSPLEFTSLSFLPFGPSFPHLNPVTSLHWFVFTPSVTPCSFPILQEMSPSCPTSPKLSCAPVFWALFYTRQLLVRSVSASLPPFHLFPSTDLGQALHIPCAAQGYRKGHLLQNRNKVEVLRQQDSQPRKVRTSSSRRYRICLQTDRGSHGRAVWELGAGRLGS